MKQRPPSPSEWFFSSETADWFSGRFCLWLFHRLVIGSSWCPGVRESTVWTAPPCLPPSPPPAPPGCPSAGGRWPPTAPAAPCRHVHVHTSTHGQTPTLGMSAHKHTRYACVHTNTHVTHVHINTHVSNTCVRTNTCFDVCAQTHMWRSCTHTHIVTALGLDWQDAELKSEAVGLCSLRC